MTRIDWLLKASPFIEMLMVNRQAAAPVIPIITPFTPAPSSPSSPSSPPSPTRPTGPDAWDLIQMEQADAQMAAYLATNPDPVTGLPQRPTNYQPPDGPLPERDRPDYREPYGDDPGPGDRILYDLYGWEW